MAQQPIGIPKFSNRADVHALATPTQQPAPQQNPGPTTLPVNGPEGSIGRYQEVYGRDASQSDPNHGIYAWQDDANRTYQLAYNSFQQLFNRAPTQNEFSSIMAAFQGANSAVNGNAYLAQLQNQYKANPSLDPSNPANNRNPQDVSSSVSQQFQSILGRAPTQDELEHFSQAIQTNQTDAYGLGSFLKQMPEYTNAQDKQFRSSINDELTGYDTKEFDRQKQGLMSQFMQNGTGNSSALDSALTELMGQISQNRSQYLTQLSASQYGGNKDLAIGNYQNTLNQMYNNNQQQRQSQQGYSQQLLNQGFQGQQYGQQMSDYMNQQASQNGYNSTLHTGDWINLGLGVGNTAARMYTAGQSGGGSPYGSLGGR